jgi:hypothetical protein
MNPDAIAWELFSNTCALLIGAGGFIGAERQAVALVERETNRSSDPKQWSVAGHEISRETRIGFYKWALRAGTAFIVFIGLRGLLTLAFKPSSIDWSKYKQEDTLFPAIFFLACVIIVSVSNIRAQRKTSSPVSLRTTPELGFFVATVIAYLAYSLFCFYRHYHQ